MIKSCLARLRQGHHTLTYPQGPAPPLPKRFRGAPQADVTQCPPDCCTCVEACPTGALNKKNVDLSRCLFCTDCVRACPHEVLKHGRDHRLAGACLTDLVRPLESTLPTPVALDEKRRRLLSQSLKLRQVSAGGCNACEADTNVLGTLAWDLGRFGIQFVASPRHADGLLITGPVSEHMAEALLKTYKAVPEPKIVIAVGACALSGGPFLGHPETRQGLGDLLPVDLYVPGCPPHPLTLLEGLLQLLGRN